jgi:hypothetical protein
MSPTAEMLETIRLHPQLDRDRVVAAIDACLACAQSCSSCADACLGEADVAELRDCIRLNLDCADLCATTARVLSRQSELDPSLLQSLVQTCVAFCKVCAAECGSHADHHDHCRVCAEACHGCERACLDLLGSMKSA